MGTSRPPLPHWTWEDLDAVLSGYSPRGEDDPVKAYLLRGLMDDSVEASPRELLRQILSTGLVMEQVGARRRVSAIDLRPGERVSVS